MSVAFLVLVCNSIIKDAKVSRLFSYIFNTDTFFPITDITG